LDVCGAFGKDDLNGVVLSNGFVISVHEINLQGVHLLIFVISEEMLTRRHGVTLIPISLPLAKDGESGLNGELDVILSPDGVGGRDVTNVIIVVKSINVLRQV
jgi:hypothetical protein